MLDIDPEGQLIASVLSKKVAAGATHVVIDIPVGPTAKVRTPEASKTIARRLKTIAGRFGLELVCVESDGSQPVGRGIGPSLEAQDVLSVLRGDKGAPTDLRCRACQIAGAILEMAGVAEPGKGSELAQHKLSDSSALLKFEEICQAQGGFREPRVAPLQHKVVAAHGGTIVHMDNRKIANVAKLAGAPDIPTAGLRVEVRLGDEVVAGQELLMIHAETPGDADYALDYARSVPDMIGIAN
jgi:thymidine phosphorylase